jgi:hypothetical protein
MSSILKINDTTVTMQRSNLKRLPYQLEFSVSFDEGFELNCTLDQIRTFGEALIAFANINAQ